MLERLFEGALVGYLWLVWSVVAVFFAWIALVLTFYAVMYAKILVDRGASFNWFFLVPIYVGFMIGLALDILFNILVGTILYRERPHELTFTARCQRHKRKGVTDWRGKKALWWCDQLSKIHAGHC